MAIAVACVFILPDFPATTKVRAALDQSRSPPQWLSPAERALAQRRMARDTGEADDNGSMTNGQAVVAVLVRQSLHLRRSDPADRRQGLVRSHDAESALIYPCS